MRILCREQQEDEVEQEVTQRDQFNTDEVALFETLVREAHQNSLDARVHGPSEPVRTKIRFIAPTEANREYFASLLQGLSPHLVASGIDLEGVDLSMPRIMLIEDFGTTGLLGKIDDRNEKTPFNNFWRRIGRSDKGGKAGGRWGLGKLVFSSASQIQTFFGLTVRSDDDTRTPYLMGQAVLSNREIDGKRYAPHVFFAVGEDHSLQLPEMDKKTVADFCQAFGVSRGNEPGLSIGIPLVLPQLQATDIAREVLRNYFFPILTGQLIVEVEGERIAKDTFEEIAKKYGLSDDASGASLINFVQEIHSAKEPDVVLKQTWVDDIGAAVEEETLDKLRSAMAMDGRMIHARAPITLKRKSGQSLETFFDLYLKKAPDGVTGLSLYVRSAITVPDEARFFTPRQTYGALVAADEVITSFLGDAENPAHTRWNGRADKLKHWKAPDIRLREIRHSLSRLQGLFLQSQETVEPDALKDLFSINDDNERRGPKKPTVPPPGPTVPPITARPRKYRIDQIGGGFSVRSEATLPADELPLELRLRVAYDVVSGDPLKKFNPLDFDFRRSDFNVKADGVEVDAVSPNELALKVLSAPFHLEISGFDRRRDLMIKVTG